MRFQERQKKDRKDMSRSESSDDNLLSAEAASGPQQVRQEIFGARETISTYALYMCMLNHCLECDKWVLNERSYPTPDSGLTHLFPRSQAVVA